MVPHTQKNLPPVAPRIVPTSARDCSTADARFPAMDRAMSPGQPQRTMPQDGDRGSAATPAGGAEDAEHSAAGGHVPGVREGFDSLVAAVIRPKRAVYDTAELGPTMQQLRRRRGPGLSVAGGSAAGGAGEGVRCMRRDDFSVLNKRGLLLRCSLWTPVIEAQAPGGEDTLSRRGVGGLFHRLRRSISGEHKEDTKGEGGHGGEDGPGGTEAGESPRESYEDQRRSARLLMEKQRQEELLPLVVYLHGNASSRLEVIKSNIFNTVASLGACLCAFDFAGSGHSQGEYVSLGVRECEDVATVVEFLTRGSRISAAEAAAAGVASMAGSARGRRVVLWGRSMGAVAALLYASRYSPRHGLGALILDSPFASFPRLVEDLAKDRVSPYIPSFVPRLALRFFSYSVQQRTNRDTGAVAGNLGAAYSGVEGAASSPERGVDEDLTGREVDLLHALDPLAEARDAGLRLPVLLLTARSDTVVPPDHGRDIGLALQDAPVAVGTFHGDHNSTRPAGAYAAAGMLLRSVFVPSASKDPEVVWRDLPWPLPGVDFATDEQGMSARAVVNTMESMERMVPQVYDGRQVSLDVRVPADVLEEAALEAAAAGKDTAGVSDGVEARRQRKARARRSRGQRPSPRVAASTTDSVEEVSL